MPKEQCGGVRLRGTDIANHIVRSALDVARITNMCVSIVFIDLVKAFDYVLREAVIGWPHCSFKSKLTWLTNLGLTPCQAQDLICELDTNGSILEQLEVHPTICQLFTSLHSSTWFVVDGAPGTLVTKKGGRQGCRFGGKLFNFVYSKALSEVHEKLKKSGVEFSFPFDCHRPFWLPCTSATSSESIKDATFVDDEAFLLFARSPKSLNQAICTCLEVVSLIFSKYNMSLNWSKGKSEAIVVYRGKNARLMSSQLEQEDGSRSLCVRSLGKKLNIVDSYKHVGSVVQSAGLLIKDAKHRASSALSAYAPLAMRVFGSNSIS